MVNLKTTQIKTSEFVANIKYFSVIYLNNRKQQKKKVSVT